MAGIKRLLVPAVWVLVAALAALEVAAALTITTGWGFLPDSGLTTLSVTLAFVAGLAVVWGGERAGARAPVTAGLVVAIAAALVLVVTWVVPTVRAVEVVRPSMMVSQVLFLVCLLAVQVLVIMALARIRMLTGGTPAPLPAAEPAALPPAEPTGRTPTWQPDKAAGAAWHTAGAAASGAAAADWGRPGERGGWTVPGSGEPQASASGDQDDLDPRAVARRYGAGAGENAPPRPPGTPRQPPRWTPLGDGDDTPPKA